MAILWGKNIKELTWEVVSTKMNKTIVVSVSWVKIHDLYKKRQKVYKKYKVHNENDDVVVGDIVKFIQTKPISKEKKWKFVEIVKKAKTVAVKAA